MSEVQTGAFVEIMVVDEYGEAGEEEVKIDETFEDIEFDRSPDAIDWVQHGDPRTKRREGAEETTGSFSMLVTDDGQNLRDAGMLGENDQILRNVIHDAVRIYIYRNEADMVADDFATVRTYEEAQFVFQSENLPTDGVGEIETEVWVHGPTIHGLGQEAE